MQPRSRRPLLPLLAALVALASTSAQAVAAIPADVALDATVVVTFTEPADGSAAGAPVAGATVVLEATRDGESLQGLSARTGADGRATFAGVARATGGTPVSVQVNANRVEGGVDSSGCSTAMSWSGQATAPVDSTAISVTIVATLASSIQCPPQGPGGSVLAATGRPRTTPPPTDAIGGHGGDRLRGGLVLAVAGVLLLAAAATLDSVRRRRRGRRAP